MSTPEWELPDESWGEARKFAAERSHSDAKETATNARATANAALLINGAALTALISYIGSPSQAGKPAALLYTGATASSLLLYLCGVVSTVFCQYNNTKSSHEWLQHWQVKAQQPSNLTKPDFFHRDGVSYSNKADAHLLRSIYCFILGSAAIFLRLVGIAIQFLGNQ